MILSLTSLLLCHRQQYPDTLWLRVILRLLHDRIRHCSSLLIPIPAFSWNGVVLIRHLKPQPEAPQHHPAPPRPSRRPTMNDSLLAVVLFLPVLRFRVGIPQSGTRQPLGRIAAGDRFSGRVGSDGGGPCRGRIIFLGHGQGCCGYAPLVSQEPEGVDRAARGFPCHR